MVLAVLAGYQLSENKLINRYSKVHRVLLPRARVAEPKLQIQAISESSRWY